MGVEFSMQTHIAVIFRLMVMNISADWKGWRSFSFLFLLGGGWIGIILNGLACIILNGQLMAAMGHVQWPWAERKYSRSC